MNKSERCICFDSYEYKSLLLLGSDNVEICLTNVIEHIFAFVNKTPQLDVLWNDL